eukprot:839067-Prorocentrum_minimum.AAC.3
MLGVCAKPPGDGSACYEPILRIQHRAGAQITCDMHAGSVCQATGRWSRMLRADSEGKMVTTSFFV